MARISLRHGLDRDVYQIVKKLEDERDSESLKKDGGRKKKPKLGVTAIYEAIKKSNSSLSRQKRKPLEDAIERVLDFRKEEEEESEDSDDLLEQAEKAYKVSSSPIYAHNDLVLTTEPGGRPILAQQANDEALERHTGGADGPRV